MLSHRIVLAASAAALAAALAFTPTRAHGDAGDTGIPCRISWEDTTHGGDWFTVRGEAELTQIIPQGGGSFVAMGQGPATITYHSTARGCRLTSPDTFTATYTVIAQSDDGQTAEIQFMSQAPSHRFDLFCPGATGERTTTSDYDPPDIPSVTAQLQEGATPFSEDNVGPNGRHAGAAGAVTLHYCRAP